MNKHQAALHELTTGTWLIDEMAGHLAFRSLLQYGAPDDHATRLTEGKMEILGIDYATRKVAQGETVPGTGLIVIKHEGMLYSWDARWIERQLAWAKAEKSIVGAVLSLDGPGGTEHAGYRVYDALRAFGKPTTAYCDHGMMGSTLYLAACGCDSIVASRSTDQIGSIGAYTTFRDVEKAETAMGYPTQAIYAPQSTEKNAEYRAGQSGNFKPIEARMKQVAQNFIDLVTERRSGVKAVDGIDPLKGALVTADVALAMGLIDGIADLRTTIDVTLAGCMDESEFFN